MACCPNAHATRVPPGRPGSRLSAQQHIDSCPNTGQTVSQVHDRSASATLSVACPSSGHPRIGWTSLGHRSSRLLTVAQTGADAPDGKVAATLLEYIRSMRRRDLTTTGHLGMSDRASSRAAPGLRKRPPAVRLWRQAIGSLGSRSHREKCCSVLWQFKAMIPNPM